MKRLTCDLCGSTNFVKEDGMFVCQDCGTKYTLEEARKMMSDGEGSAPSVVQQANSVQIENLMNMAQSSFDSKNYAKAEEFCNQVIALDGKHYAAWKLKGEAINYQINASNQRILEVYNCIMTSYRVLDDAGKKEKKYEILSSLKTCFEGEIAFWLQQFEAGRPTQSALTRVKNSYIDSYNKMKAAFEELELEDSKAEYLTNFDNFFVGKCNATCNSAWKTTVGYNYYRDYMGKGVDPFGRTDKRWVLTNTDLYRPMKNTWDTFLSETDNLIALLQFAEQQFNDETNPKVMEAIYSNIAYFEECVIPSGSWKITSGYTSNWDQYKSVGWHEEYSLNDQAKSLRREIMAQYTKKMNTVPAQVEARQKEKREQERKDKIKKYWETHADLKEKLENEQAEIKRRVEELEAQIAETDNANAPKIAELEKKLAEPTPAELEADKQRDFMKELESQRDRLGLFKGKEKKAINDQLASVEKPRLEELAKKAAAEKAAYQEKIGAQLEALKNDRKELRDEREALLKRSDEIQLEFSKDR